MNHPQISPSPQSRNARKPLINLTSHFNNASHELNKSIDKIKVIPPRSESTKNIKPRVSTGENNKVNELRQRKNSLIKQGNKQGTTQKGEHCRNHPKRMASHQIVNQPGEQYCFECAYVLIRKNIKMCKIKQNKQDTKKECENDKRQQELNRYLQKCSHVKKVLQSWSNKQSNKADEIYADYAKRIRQEMNHMEIEIERVRDIYTASIESLEKRRETKINQIQNNQMDMQKLLRDLNDTRLDIESEIEGIKSKLSSSEFGLVMAGYWKIIDKAEVFIKKQVVTEYKTTEFTIDKELTNSNMENTNQGYYPESEEKNLKKSKQQGKDFTFSKNNYSKTPQICKALKGIKFADSEGQTDQKSSMKSSIVDSKFTFQ